MCAFGSSPSEIGSGCFEKVPVDKKVRREMWQKIALDMLEMMYKGKGQAGDKNFKELRHNRGHVYIVREDLIKNGVIRRVGGSKYELVTCKLRPRDERARSLG